MNFSLTGMSVTFILPKRAMRRASRITDILSNDFEIFMPACGETCRFGFSGYFLTELCHGIWRVDFYDISFKDKYSDIMSDVFERRLCRTIDHGKYTWTKFKIMILDSYDNRIRINSGNARRIRANITKSA